MCSSDLGPFNGDQRIAEILLHLMDSDLTSLLAKRVRYQRLLAVSPFEIGISTLARRALNSLLRLAAIAFRTLFPHKKDNAELSQVFLSNTKDFRIATKWIRENERFEHILFGSSSSYLKSRTEIAKKAYEVESGQKIGRAHV